MDESERTENEGGAERGPDPASEPASTGPSPASGPTGPGGPPPAQQFGDQDGARRRRRGRRGRGGGGGGGFGGPRPPYNGPRPQFNAPRPQFGAPQFRPQQQFAPREESEQARELAGYERRQAQRQRGPMGWRGGAGGSARAPQGGGRSRRSADKGDRGCCRGELRDQGDTGFARTGSVSVNFPIWPTDPSATGIR